MMGRSDSSECVPLSQADGQVLSEQMSTPEPSGRAPLICGECKYSRESGHFIRADKFNTPMPASGLLIVFFKHLFSLPLKVPFSRPANSLSRTFCHTAKRGRAELPLNRSTPILCRPPPPCCTLPPFKTILLYRYSDMPKMR